MVKLITLLAGAFVAGQMRYPAEGPITVSDDDAERLIADDQAELVVVVDVEESIGLGELKLEDLKSLAASSFIDLEGAKSKADIVAAIELHRENAEAWGELAPVSVDDLVKLAATEKVDLKDAKKKADIIPMIQAHRKSVAPFV